MIYTLDIENYKCFHQQCISFGKITVLAGANSAGKSSVIQALLLSRIIHERLCAVNFARVNGITAPLNGQYQLSLGNIAEVLNHDANEDIIRFTFNRQVGSVARIELLAERSQAAYELPLIATIPDHQPFPSYSLFADQFHYLNAERIGPRLKYEVESMPYLRVGAQGENSLHVLSHQQFPIDDSRTVKESKLLPVLFQQTQEWMSFIVPGVSIDKVGLLGKIKTAEVSYGESSPPNVGFGVSYVLPIVLSGLIAAEKSMLIVENPEAHLHPSGQSRIGQFLGRMAAAGVQVVVETHSEHVINGIRVATLDSALSPDDALVNFFSRTDDDQPHVTTIHFTQKGDLDQWPRDFFDQQQQDFARIIRLKNQQKNG